MTTATLTLTDFLLARVAEDEFAIPWGECRCAENTRRPDCPDRITADIESKRQVMEMHTPHHLSTPEFEGAVCESCQTKRFPCPTLRALASVYADHPDYREEWRP